MRNRSTDGEIALWKRLQHQQLGVKFRRQHPVAPYIADFCAPSIGLIVEADGGQHNDDPADERRTKFLESNGYSVLRFWNNDILKNMDGVVETIWNKVRELSAVKKGPPPPPPPPPKAGGGG
jgi:very-short-patch-repair endonuclease